MDLTKVLQNVQESSSPAYYTGVTRKEVLQVAQGGQPIMVQGIPEGHTIQIQGQPGQQIQVIPIGRLSGQQGQPQQPSSINGPYIVEVWGGFEEVVPVGAMNGSDQAAPNSLTSTGNGSRDMKLQKKSRERGLELITLKDVGEDHREIHFRVKMSTEMGKVKRSYSNRLGVPVTSLRFLFNGREINDDETPRQLKMENDVVIEVIQDKHVA